LDCATFSRRLHFISEFDFGDCSLPQGYGNSSSNPNPCDFRSCYEQQNESNVHAAIQHQMRNIVYLLGAGFSAPLGIPTISTFYWKAKDLYESDPVKFAHFSKSFELMDSFGRLKTFMKADLENIEEILSILEMAEALSSELQSQPFSNFISDVIVAYTPEIPAPEKVRDDDLTPNILHFFGKNALISKYCLFVSQLLALRRPRQVNGKWTLERGEPFAHYSVINLNYDRVLESACEYIQKHYPQRPPLRFYDPTSKIGATVTDVMLAKLHGSVTTEIVPPTWNKKIHLSVLPAWQAAFASVANANELRFIGYSLPETDSYFRYFLKAAISKSFNLQRVDVLCSGNVQNRYQQLFEANRLHFIGGQTEQYLSHLANFAKAGATDALEQAHCKSFPRRA
jgi:SIR2-like domain